MKGNDAFLYGDGCEIIGLNQRKPRLYGGPTGLVQFFYQICNIKFACVISEIRPIINIKSIRLIDTLISKEG